MRICASGFVRCASSDRSPNTEWRQRGAKLLKIRRCRRIHSERAENRTRCEFITCGNAGPASAVSPGLESHPHTTSIFGNISASSLHWGPTDGAETARLAVSAQEGSITLTVRNVLFAISLPYRRGWGAPTLPLLFS